ncbi:PAS domain-containing sensor histidine kinase [Leptospira ognonensis]|uniref:histidine kinase n=1 Tax=Leptospira ognonensis TaxID=2484945 RepID=A0A4R9JTX1_9LEPT|nr:ATP-binding protein [Leptospira ognonensis]TGL56212.1 PAS domain-containing sensor histidine kinase [Leptospira ognonensis]
MNDSLRSFLSQIFSSFEPGFLIFDSLSSKIEYADESCLSFLGYEKDIVTTLPLERIFSNPSELTGSTQNKISTKVILKDGSIQERVLNINRVTNPFQENEILYIVNFYNIIPFIPDNRDKESKETEIKLRNSEERLRTIFASMNNGIVMVDSEGIIQEIAPIFKFLLFQYIPLEKGDFIFSFLEEELRISFLETLQEVAQSLISKSKEFHYEILNVEYTFEVRFLPIRHYKELENILMLVFTDRSEAKRLDRQLIESMKFASIGEIAAGLAHEINNPLQSALLYLDDLIIAGEEDPVERKMILKKIESANLRIRDLVRSLLDLGRAESQTRDLVSPYYILVRSSELVEASCKKKGIIFNRHAGPNLPGIIVRWQEIEQVLINCVVNSINALSEMLPPRENPKIEIGIDLINLNKKDWVVFSIEDNGPGMSEDIIEKAFLPLFTTRREMQGTGLGLSISKKIINDHEGEINIKSKIGNGTKIEILLPAQVEKND